MRLKQLLSKSLLLAAAAWGGVNGAWADNITAIPASYDFSAADATIDPFNNSSIVSGTNIGNVLLVNQKSTATAWVDVDAEAEGRQAYEIAANEKVTVGLSVYHGWESNNRSATVSVYNPDGISLASYVYNIKDCKITKVSFGDTAVDPFTAFGYKNTGNGTNNFLAGQHLDISIAISGSGYIETNFMNGSTNVGSYSATLPSNVSLKIARIEINSSCDVADRGYHVKSLSLTSETVTDATITYQFQDTEGNSLASIKSDQTAPGSIGSSIEDVIPEGYKATFYNGDSSVKYVYDSFSCTDEIVPADGTTVILKFAALNKFTYNVKAVDDDDNELATIATTSGFAGEVLSLFWSKYVKVGDVWYVANAPFYQDEITEEGEKRITYTASDIAYFIECESMNGVRQDRWVLENSASNSGYYKIRINQYYPTIYTAVFENGGVFDLSLPYSNSNASNSTYQIRTRDASGNMTDIAEWTCEGGINTYTLKNIVIPAGSSLAISCDGISGNSNARMDYLTLTASKVSVPVTNGWATYANHDVALDFTGVEGLTAYTATVSGDEVTFKPATKVPAGTGLLLKGETKDVPVIASADDIADNALYAPTVAVEGLDYDQDGYYNYILTQPSGKQVGFYRANGNSVAVGKAYLRVSKDVEGARELTFIGLDGADDVTGISTIATADADAACYNLSGQRVAQPRSGLYIMGGKKVIIK